MKQTTIKKFYSAVFAVTYYRTHPDFAGYDVINEVANMYSDSYDEYCELCAALEAYFA